MAVTEKTTTAQQPALDNEGLDRGVGFLGLLWSSEGSIIGSGWLFGALTAASIAGPSVIIAWVVASFIIIVLALIHAELGGLFPVSGGTSRFPHYAFGSLAGATFGWFAYLQAASVAPIEVLAAIQYASTYSFAHSWYNGAQNTLHGAGYAVAVGLMVVFVILNIVGIRWLARANNALTSWKVLIPIVTIIVLLVTQFHGSNFSAAGGFFIHGSAVKSILIAIPTGGIVFSLLGFEQAVQLGGEARNPSKDLPRAVILSILIGGAIYVLVQVAFIGALEPRLLVQAKTWSGLVPGNQSQALAALNAAPFYQVATLAGITWLATILRIDAIVSPGGTGLIYTTSSSRISFGLSRNGYIPEAFERNSQRTKVPVFSIIIAAIIGLLFLLPFPSWSKLVGVVTSASVMMYAGAPLALGALRLQKPELPRPYRIPGGQVMAAIGFILASLIVYWAGWGTYSTLMVALLIGYALMLASAAFRLNPHQPRIDWAAAWWIFPYLIGMGILSYFGTFGSGGILDGVGVFKNVLVGGNNDLGLYGGIIAVSAWALIIYGIAISRRLPSEQVDEYVRDVYPPPVAE